MCLCHWACKIYSSTHSNPVHASSLIPMRCQHRTFPLKCTSFILSPLQFPPLWGAGEGAKAKTSSASFPDKSLHIECLSPHFSIPHMPQCHPSQISQGTLIKFTLYSSQIIFPHLHTYPFGNPQTPNLPHTSTFHSHTQLSCPPTPHPLHVSVQTYTCHLSSTH